MIQPDPIAALVALLLADVGDLQALVGTRVYGYELDVPETKSQARAAVVIQPAPGPANAKGCMRLGTINIDVFCYGANPTEAGIVRLAVYEIFKFTIRQVFAETLLQSIVALTSGTYMRDKDTNWPLMMQSFSVLANEAPVT